MSTPPKLNWLMRQYQLLIRQVPFYKYSSIVIIAAIIAAIIVYLGLEVRDVFVYSLIILGISLIGYLLFAMTNRKDKVMRIAIYILVFTLTLAVSGAIFSLGAYIVTGNRSFYDRLLFNSRHDSITVAKKDSNNISHLPPARDSQQKPIVSAPRPSKGVDAGGSTGAKKDQRTAADGRMRIAILPFENISQNGDHSYLTKAIPEAILGEVSTKDGLVLLEGVLRDKVLAEINFQQGKYVDPSTAVKFGKMIGASHVIIGSYLIQGQVVELKSRTVEVETGAIQGKSVVAISGEFTQLLQLEKTFAQKIKENL